MLFKIKSSTHYGRYIQFSYKSSNEIKIKFMSNCFPSLENVCKFVDALSLYSDCVLHFGDSEFIKTQDGFIRFDEGYMGFSFKIPNEVCQEAFMDLWRHVKG